MTSERSDDTAAITFSGIDMQISYQADAAVQAYLDSARRAFGVELHP